MRKMLKRKQMIVAAAALAAAPLATKAAVVTFTYNPVVLYGTNPGVTAGTATASVTNNKVTIPSGDYFQIGVQVLVTGDTNAASGGAYDKGSSGVAGSPQPANLGLTGFGFNIANSTPANVVPRVSGASAAFVSHFVPADSATNSYNPSSVGTASTTTGVVSAIQAGLNPGSSNATPATYYLLNLGAGTAQDIFTGLTYHALNANTDVLTPSVTGPNSIAYAVLASAGGTNTAPTYVSHITTNTDTVNILPALTVNPGAVTTGGGPTTHNIVSLTSATQTGGNYGVQLASGQGNNQATFNPGTNAPLITVVNHGAGVYTSGAANNVNGGAGDATDFTGVTGFLAGDQEVYALKLKVGGATPTSTQINTIVTDISGQTGDGVSTVASLLTPSAGLPTQIAALFPGYDLLLSVAAGSGSTTPFLGFDFSQETNVAGVTVTDIGAVPEPASAAMLLIGSSGLLLGRRKRVFLNS
jgi:hypothetical protein